MVRKNLVIAASCAALMALPTTVQAERITQTRDLDGFTEVSLNGLGRITVNVGESYSVTIEAEEELMDYILTEVDGSELNIRRDRGSRSAFRRHGMRVDITVNLPKLEGFDINGSGRSRISNLDADNFRFDANGSGRSYISGTCESGDFDMNGSGRLDAEDLTCNNVKIDANGSGGIRMTVNGDVEIDTSGSGGIDLLGSPRLTKLTGRGSGPVNIGGN